MGFKGKTGGGFWANVDGELVGYSFETFTANSGNECISLKPEIKVDGQEEATSRGLLFGMADRYEVSDDGKTVTAKDGGAVSYSADLPAGQWLDSFVDAGEKLDIGNLLPDLDAGEPFNLEGVLGTRFRLGTITDVKGTKDRGQETGKDGVKRDRKFNVITDVYSLPGKSDTSRDRSSGTRPGKVGAKTPDTSIRDKADKVVVDLIEAAVDKKNKTGETPVSKFKMAALRALGKDKDKDAVIKMIGDEGYRADAVERGVFAYDAEAETVSIEA